MMHTRFAILLATIVLFGRPGATWADWPTWRGPGMAGIAAGSPPTNFSESVNLKWKIQPPGSGDATPVVWGDRIFLLAARKTEKALPAVSTQAIEARLSDENRGRIESVAKRFGISAPKNAHDFLVICLDRKDGRELWQTTVCTETPHEGHHPDHGYASGSPVTDGRHVWCFFGSRGMHCLDVTGKIVWQRQLGHMVTRARFGEATSPALTGKAVVALLDHEGESEIVAMDRLSGKTLWKQARAEETSWTTPFVTTVDGVEQIIVNGHVSTCSYRADDGAVLWECTGQTENVVPVPVRDATHVYCASGFRGNMMQAIALGRQGKLDGTDAIAWEITRNTPYVPSPLLYKDCLYMLSANRPQLSCINPKNGELYYSNKRIESMTMVYASPVAAAGHIYIAGRKGKVAVIKAGPEFNVLAVNTLDDGFDASPVIVGNELYLRGNRSLYCIGAHLRFGAGSNF